MNVCACLRLIKHIHMYSLCCVVSPRALTTTHVPWMFLARTLAPRSSSRVQANLLLAWHAMDRGPDPSMFLRSTLAPESINSSSTSVGPDMHAAKWSRLQARRSHMTHLTTHLAEMTSEGTTEEQVQLFLVINSERKNKYLKCRNSFQVILWWFKMVPIYKETSATFIETG